MLAWLEGEREIVERTAYLNARESSDESKEREHHKIRASVAPRNSVPLSSTRELHEEDGGGEKKGRRERRTPTMVTPIGHGAFPIESCK